MRYIITILLGLVSALTFGQITIDVRNEGAVGDSVTVNTTFIQAAIDSVSNSGGGTVLITGGGVYTSSTIILKSNVTLRVAPGTKLKSIMDIQNLPKIPYNTPSWSTVYYTEQSLIFAEDAVNIRITGGGTIDGFGGYDNILNVLSISNKNLRPFGFRLHEISGLTIDSINFYDAPQWMGHIAGCSNVYINAINIYNQGLGSNDGIDIDCCRTVLVENSNFDTDDDCIPVKTHSDSICRDITIRNCTMATYERPVKVGNESLGPIVNVHIENITVNASSNPLPEVPYNAVYVAIADGGSADSIFINNIQVNTPYQSALFIRLCERDDHWDSTKPYPPVQYLRNVWISNVNCTADSTEPASITGLPGYDVQNINLQNINITVPGRGPVGTPDISNQPSVRPEFNIWGDSLPAYGLFMWHANGVYLDSFCVDTQHYDQRPLYYCMDTVNIPNLTPCSYYNIVIPAAIGDISTPDKEISIYPNPANNLISVSNLPPQAELVTLNSLTGQMVLAVPNLGRNSTALDVSNLQGGLYLLSVLGSNYRANFKVAVVK